MKVWNITPRSATPSRIIIYGVDVRPGQCSKIPKQSYENNPAPLQAHVRDGNLSIDTLPAGYHQEVQDVMVKILNKSGEPVTFKGARGENLATVVIQPGETGGFDRHEYPNTALILEWDDRVELTEVEENISPAERAKATKVTKPPPPPKPPGPAPAKKVAAKKAPTKKAPTKKTTTKKKSSSKKKAKKK